MGMDQIFVSSVQKELQAERYALRDFVHDNDLLRQFFRVFLFEDLPPADRRPDNVYLDEVARSSIYLGIFSNEYGWEDTGQHHMDNEMFALVYYYARHKFGFDWRIVELSAKVRTGVASREQALAALESVPFFENEELVEYGLKKQGFSREEFDAILNAPNKFFTDYPSYYPMLRLFRIPIKMLCRMDILPAHVYEKYFDAI